MKKLLFAIFAHPDDEAFGPSGTLLKLKDEGWDVHLVLLTDGEAGVNIDHIPNLAATRLAEWQLAASIIGALSTTALHFPDGKLDDIPLADLERTLTTTITHILEGYPEAPEISFMTFEPHGITGHRDHIVASTLTTKLASHHHAQHVWYFCLDKKSAPLENTAYYEPRAREDKYITDTIDVSAYVDTKCRVIEAHVSQRQDAQTMKKLDLATEHFHITS